MRHSLLGGLLIAAFVSIPIVNLATPLFAMSLMVHVHKRLGGARRSCAQPLDSEYAIGRLLFSSV